MNAAPTRITSDPRVCGGQPCIRGIRVPVTTVLRSLAAGQTADEVLAEFPELVTDDVGECLRYAAQLASARQFDGTPR